MKFVAVEALAIFHLTAASLSRQSTSSANLRSNAAASTDSEGSFSVSEKVNDQVQVIIKNDELFGSSVCLIFGGQTALKLGLETLAEETNSTTNLRSRR